MRVVWPGIFVTDDNIAQCIREISRTGTDSRTRSPSRDAIFRASIWVPQRGESAACPCGRPRGAQGCRVSFIAGRSEIERV
jgi:hypothetical protein